MADATQPGTGAISPSSDAGAVCILSLPDCSGEPAECQDPASVTVSSWGVSPAQTAPGPPSQQQLPPPLCSLPGQQGGDAQHPPEPHHPAGTITPRAEPGTRLLGATVQDPSQPQSAEGGSAAGHPIGQPHGEGLAAGRPAGMLPASSNLSAPLMGSPGPCPTMGRRPAPSAAPSCPGQDPHTSADPFPAPAHPTLGGSAPGPTAENRKSIRKGNTGGGPVCTQRPGTCLQLHPPQAARPTPLAPAPSDPVPPRLRAKT